MSEETSRVTLDEKVKAEDRLYADMFHTGDNKLVMWGFIVAFVIHAIVLIAPLPDFKQVLKPKAAKKSVTVRKYVPPPPPVERRRIEKKKLTRKVPIPDPTPDEPEPMGARLTDSGGRAGDEYAFAGESVHGLRG